MSKQFIFILGLNLLLTACGGGGGGSASNSTGESTSPDPCGVAAQIDFVEEVATDYYYWYDELADVDKRQFSNAQDYLRAIMRPIWCDLVDAPGNCQSTGRDPGFSYLTTIEEDSQRFESGVFFGYGVRYRLVGSDFFFSDSYETGPAFAAGIRRGQRLIAVDRGDGFVNWDQIFANTTSTDLRGAVLGPSEELKTTVFRVETVGGIQDISVTTAETTTPPFAGTPVLIPTQNGTPVGYIHFRSFIDDADEPLREVAETFAAAGVTDVVIDLRYNGGGLLRVAETFLNLLAGDVAQGETSYIVNRNDKHSEENNVGTFVALQESFSPSLNRIAFITTLGSASASELLINSLEPHIEVAIIGSDTSGKAVGQGAWDLNSDRCETRLRLVAFEIQNGLGEGGYYNGLVDTGRFTFFLAADDVTREFGDVGEESLQVALNWLGVDVASSQARSLKRSSKAMRMTREQIGVAGFDASWRADEQPPLNPDGTVRSF
mgnify:CR=1 FL=1